MDLRHKITLLSRISLANNSTVNEVKIAQDKIKLLTQRLDHAKAELKVKEAEARREEEALWEAKMLKSKAESEAMLAAFEASQKRDDHFGFGGQTAADHFAGFNVGNHWHGRK
jgi:hypothetical protein